MQAFSDFLFQPSCLTRVRLEQIRSELSAVDCCVLEVRLTLDD
jgi:hypothetical protein